MKNIVCESNDNVRIRRGEQKCRKARSKNSQRWRRCDISRQVVLNCSARKQERLQKDGRAVRAGDHSKMNAVVVANMLLHYLGKLELQICYVFKVLQLQILSCDAGNRCLRNVVSPVIFHRLCCELGADPFESQPYLSVPPGQCFNPCGHFAVCRCPDVCPLCPCL